MIVSDYFVVYLYKQNSVDAFAVIIHLVIIRIYGYVELKQ